MGTVLKYFFTWIFGIIAMVLMPIVILFGYEYEFEINKAGDNIFKEFFKK